MFLVSFTAKRGSVAENATGWKGEQRRPSSQRQRRGENPLRERGRERDRSLAGGDAQHRRPVLKTLGQKYHQEDLERGTWVEMISWRPRAFVIHNFMTSEEADQLIEIAKPFMARSTVIDSTTGEPTVDEIRTR